MSITGLMLFLDREEAKIFRALGGLVALVFSPALVVSFFYLLVREIAENHRTRKRERKNLRLF